MFSKQEVLGVSREEVLRLMRRSARIIGVMGGYAQWVWVFFFMLALVMDGVMCRAQTVPPVTPSWDAVGQKEELKRLENALEQSQKHQEILREEAMKTEAARRVLAKRMGELSLGLRARERAMTEAETLIASLMQRSSRLEISLKADREALARFVATLQRITAQPPPPLFDTGQSLDSIRGGLLISSVMAIIREKNRRLLVNLKELSTLHERLRAQRAQLKEQVMAWSLEKKNLEELDRVYVRVSKSQAQKIEEEQKKNEILAEKAKNLQELLAHLEEERKKSLHRRENHPIPQRGIGFSKRRATLLLPAEGEKIRSFGDPDGFGNVAQGLFLATRPMGEVLSPVFGTVVYAAPFHGYGQLLILDVGEGYYMLLSGLGKIRVFVGQRVEPLETIGAMPEVAENTPLLADWVAGKRPLLYIEFRKDGAVIDPSPWWIATQRKKG